MIKRILTVNLLLIALISISYGDESHLIGNKLGDSFIYTNRKSWEEDYRKEALDKTIYRLGNDIVLFIGRKSSGKPDLLEMTPSKNFTQDELRRFTDSSARFDIPPRDHELFNNLSRGGFQSK